MEYLVHGHGFAEIEKADSPAQAVAQFRRLAQEVNPDLDIFSMDFQVEPANQHDPLWESESRNQHLMAYGFTEY